MLCKSGKEIFDKRGTSEMTVPNRLEYLQLEQVEEESIRIKVEPVAEKMLLDDVAINILYPQNIEPIPINDIDKIQNEIDLNQEISIILKVGLHTLKDLKNNLKRRFGLNCPTLNGFICKKIDKLNEELVLQQHSSSLSFDNRDPRIDQLRRLLKIAEVFEIQPNFPIFKFNHIESIIRDGLKFEQRTLEKYLKCIKNYVEYATDKALLFNSDYDLFYFKDAIFLKMQELQTK